MRFLLTDVSILRQSGLPMSLAESSSIHLTDSFFAEIAPVRRRLPGPPSRWRPGPRRGTLRTRAAQHAIPALHARQQGSCRRFLRAARHHDRRAAARLRFAGQARTEPEGRRQAVAALLPQLLRRRRQRPSPFAPNTEPWPTAQQPYARRRRAGAHRRSQARQHPWQPSRLGRQQPAVAARRRSRCPWRAPSGSPPTPAMAPRSKTTSASRPKPRFAPRKKTPRPTSARSRPQISISQPAPPVVVDRAAWEQRVTRSPASSATIPTSIRTSSC